jgi:hypothetical protein
MWQRFTERARKVVFFAQQEAQRFGESYVSTEHLLLGLVKEADSIAARVLDRMGVSLSRLQTEVERQLPRGDARATQEMQLTPRAKRVIDLAYDEARQLSNNYIGTEHLLLGLIREGEGLAGRVLEKLGVGLEAARRETMLLQDADPNRPAPPPLPKIAFTEAGRRYERPHTPEVVFHTQTAVSLYNAVWEALKKPTRTEAENEQMLTAAHASMYHWSQAGSVLNFIRGGWQLSRVYAVLGWPGLALHYANRSLDLCEKSGTGDYDLAFAYEALARANALAGDADNREKYLALARQTGEQIKDDEDRGVFLAELATVPEVQAGP